MSYKMNVTEFYRTLEEQFASRDFKRIEEYMLNVLNEAKVEMNFSVLIAASNELGGLYRSMGRIAEAVVLNDSVLEALRSIGQDQTENYAAALINAGNSHNSAKEYEKALELYLAAEKLLMKLGLDQDYRMAALNNNISALYRERNQLLEAEAAAEKSLTIIERIPDARGEYATSLINLGEVQTSLGKYSEAEETLKNSAAIFEQEMNGRDIHYAAAIAALGVLEYRRGNYDASISYYRRAMALVERDFGHSAYYQLLESNLKKVESEKP